MFCQNCGKELEDNWTVCPYCGNRILPIENEVEDEIKKGGEETDEDMKLLKTMIQEHPVRAILCIPAVIYILYLIYQLISTDFSKLTIWMFINICVKGAFCNTALWLLYGPVNLKGVKEKVKKKPQKGYGIASHIGSVIFGLVILAVCNYMMEEPAVEGTAADKMAVSEGAGETGNQSTGDEAAGDMTIEEYISKCQEVTGEDLVRNPEQYMEKKSSWKGALISLRIL